MRGSSRSSRRGVHVAKGVSSRSSPALSELTELSTSESESGDAAECQSSIRVTVSHNSDTSIVKREPEDDGHLLKANVEGPPRKKRRLVVEVVVPTWAAVKKKEKMAYEEDLKKLKKMKNQDPKVKKVKNMELLPDTVRSRLKHLNLDLYPITLDKAKQELMVTRQFMSFTYGGSTQQNQPSIAKKFLDKHHMDDFFYLNLSYQPEAPQVPGAHGLYFCTQPGPDIPGIHRVFTRILDALWQFMGFYTAKATAALTKEEWAIQPARVRNTWAKQICVQRWGGSVMTRVAFRKQHGREPTNAEFDQFYRSGKYKRTTPDEVSAAYDKGEETLGVWVLECVGYDDKFQLELCDKFPEYVPPPPKAKAEKDSQTPKVVTQKERKRKRTQDVDSETDEKYGQHLVYRPRGTRSRPIHL